MSFTHIFARFVIRFRWPVVILVLAMTALFTYQLRHMSLPEELADIAPQGHPFVKLQHHMGQVFGIGSMVVIALELREGGKVEDIFNRLIHINFIEAASTVQPDNFIAINRWIEFRTWIVGKLDFSGKGKLGKANQAKSKESYGQN